MWVVIGSGTPAMSHTSVLHPDTQEMTVLAEMSPRFVRTPRTRPPSTWMPSTRVYGWIATPALSASFA
jgi:hypothetical protein